MGDLVKDSVHDTELDGNNHDDENKTDVAVHDPLLKQYRDIADTDPNGKPDYNKLPVDTGWSWIILFCVSFVIMINVGLYKSSGIIFVAIQERFGSSASMTSLISTLTTASFSVTSMFVMNLGSKFLSDRTITVVGILTSCVTYIIASVAQNFELLLLSNGVLRGVGLAFIEPIAFAIIGSYFEKHRGLACSISSSGGSLGGLVFAPLLTAMLEYYGFSGTMLMIAAFVFQCLVSAVLIRPQSFYSHGEKKIEATQANSETNTTDACLRKENNTEAITSVDQYVEQVKQSAAVDSRIVIHNLTQPVCDGAAQLETIKDKTERANNDLHTHIGVIRGEQSTNVAYSNGDCATKRNIIIDDTAVSHTETVLPIRKKCSCFQKILDLFDFSLFKDPIFIVLFLAGNFMCVPAALSKVYLAPHGKDINLKPAEIANILAIYSAIDLCCRLAFGFISDRKWIRRSTMIAISAFIVCAVSQFMSFYSTFSWLLFYSVVYGIFGGSYFAILTPLILDYFPLAKLNSVLGFIILAEAIFGSSGFVIVGTLRDTTGSYVASFHFLGAMAVIGGLLFAVLPVVERFHRSQKNT